MDESLLSLLSHLGILTNTCDALTLIRIVASSPNQQEHQPEGVFNENNQKIIKRASHSGMEIQNAMEIKEEPQSKGNKKSCLTNNKNSILGGLDPRADLPLLVLGHR
jgi:hypothetical protein